MEARGQDRRTCRTEVLDRRPVLAALLTSAFAAVAVPGAAQAQTPAAWRSLTVPAYPNATDYSAKSDEDEYEIRFKSQDDAQAVFTFYRDYLQQQGFRVVNTKTTIHGFKADMVRGQGGPDNMVELDAKLRNGWHKVEIEFDD